MADATGRRTMDDSIDIRLGPLSIVRWAWWAFLFSAVGLAFIVPDPTTDDHQPINAGLGWFLVACGVLFAALAARALCWYRAGKVLLALTPEGLRGRPTQDLLVPWSQVKSVRRVTRRPSTFALDTQSFWLGYIVSATDPFRYDAYEVELDKELVEKGVKGERALGVGFDIVPALMSFSSAQVAQAFSHWLPAERCLEFENRADPIDATEFRDRLLDTGKSIALTMDSPQDLLAAGANMADVAAQTAVSAEQGDGAATCPTDTDTSSDSDCSSDDDGGSDDS